ncbi:uncharacterized protein (DUF2236 family) [Tamaricihabitans halophyticus]|uniref:Uncharacterized protein (DUF2236 family) n=1 Tax=Tamaricihabitans halophyticus TaxID=1262583 RepID=A0A4R2QJ93_9PSEU|nr:oxygenase MpaB family protein [Tamaricihabitans halophyticus]TCP49337.1 uncharacterized protein (DUF2236 family) [Tamaricihabitans halophyticus]
MSTATDSNDELARSNDKPAQPNDKPARLNDKPAGSRRELERAIVGASLAAGTANVIMQLALPGVGYGVVESTVESGQLFRHPKKRTRTTLTYLAVASMGTDAERTAYRKAVNTSHAQVRSGEHSPVRYNAFDPKLQLWVAACLYRGVEDTYRAFIGPLDPETTERLYQESAKLGTTLQVPADMWPANRAEFERYWQSALDEVHIDDTVRAYLIDVMKLRFMPRHRQLAFGRLSTFLTTGFLPQRFREEMRLPWRERDQRLFDAFTTVVRVIVRLLPTPLRQYPYNAYLNDLRKRIKQGRRLV